MTKAEIAVIEQELGQMLEAGRFEETATLAIRRYGPQILGYLIGLLRDEELAHDAFSRFCEELWKGMAAFRRESPLRTWAYRIAWRAAARIFRDPYYRRGRRLETEEISQLVDSVRSCATALYEHKARNQMTRLRDALDADEQTLLTLRIDRELSWGDIAFVLSEPGQEADEATLRKRFERVKEKLRKMADSEGLLPS